jgi:hypothetical protein
MTIYEVIWNYMQVFESIIRFIKSLVQVIYNYLLSITPQLKLKYIWCNKDRIEPNIIQ